MLQKFSCKCQNLSECVHSKVNIMTVCSPDAADSSSFDVQLGDIILTATDGLFDNMPDYMILQELKKLKVGDGMSDGEAGAQLQT